MKMRETHAKAHLDSLQTRGSKEPSNQAADTRLSRNAWEASAAAGKQKASAAASQAASSCESFKRRLALSVTLTADDGRERVTASESNALPSLTSGSQAYACVRLTALFFSFPTPAFKLCCTD